MLSRKKVKVLRHQQLFLPEMSLFDTQAPCSGCSEWTLSEHEIAQQIIRVSDLERRLLLSYHLQADHPGRFQKVDAKPIT